MNYNSRYEIRILKHDLGGENIRVPKGVCNSAWLQKEEKSVIFGSQQSGAMNCYSWKNPRTGSFVSDESKNTDCSQFCHL